MADRAARRAEPALDLAALEAAIGRAPIEVRERLAHHFTPSALRAGRLAERDEVLMMMAAGQSGDAMALARWVQAKLLRYATVFWRYDFSAPRHQRDALTHRALRLAGGAIPSVRVLRRLPWPKTAEEMATRLADDRVATQERVA